jgi:hypothetical protein
MQQRTSRSHGRAGPFRPLAIAYVTKTSHSAAPLVVADSTLSLQVTGLRGYSQDLAGKLSQAKADKERLAADLEEAQRQVGTGCRTHHYVYVYSYSSQPKLANSHRGPLTAHVVGPLAATALTRPLNNRIKGHHPSPPTPPSPFSGAQAAGPGGHARGCLRRAQIHAFNPRPRAAGPQAHPPLQAPLRHAQPRPHGRPRRHHQRRPRQYSHWAPPGQQTPPRTAEGRVRRRQPGGWAAAPCHPRGN